MPIRYFSLARFLCVALCTLISFAISATSNAQSFFEVLKSHSDGLAKTPVTLSELNTYTYGDVLVDGDTTWVLAAKLVSESDRFTRADGIRSSLHSILLMKLKASDSNRLGLATRHLDNNKFSSGGLWIDPTSPSKVNIFLTISSTIHTTPTVC
jgi:hypothetical protein